MLQTLKKKMVKTIYLDNAANFLRKTSLNNELTFLKKVKSKTMYYQAKEILK
jgi:hypothetical protein